MSPEEAFLIFGLSPEATWSEVQRRYKEEALAWHPDRFRAGSASCERAQQRLKQLNAARDCLRIHLRNPGGPPPDCSGDPAEREPVDMPSASVREFARFPTVTCGLGALCGGLMALGLGWLFGVKLLVALAIGLVTGGMAGGLSSDADPRHSPGRMSRD